MESASPRSKLKKTNALPGAKLPPTSYGSPVSEGVHPSAGGQEDADRFVTILAVGLSASDVESLRAIIGHSNWKLFEAPDGQEALRMAEQHHVAVMLVERDLPGETWQDLLKALKTSTVAPMMIVSSRRADESFWAEVLSLGAYDVLVEPFDQREVVRVVSMAWLQWKQHRTGKGPRFRPTLAAGSAGA